MNEDKSSGFRFRIDEESPDTLLRDDVDDRSLKKLSTRVTRLMVLLPLLLGLAGAAAYYDLKQDVRRGLDTGQVESLSQDLNSKFSSLSLQYAKLEDSVQNIQESFTELEAAFDKKVLPLDEIFLVFEKTTSALKDDLAEAKTTVETLKAAKIDKTEFVAAMDRIDNRIAPVNRYLKNMESEIKALDENLTQELAELSGNFHNIQSEINKFDKLQKDVSALSAAKLDKKGLEAELNAQEKAFQQELKSVKQDLRKKEETFKSMETQIEELMKFKALSEIKKRLQPAAAAPPPQPAAGPSAAPETPPAGKTDADLLPPPAPGKIVEETLKPQ